MTTKDPTTPTVSKMETFPLNAEEVEIVQYLFSNYLLPHYDFDRRMLTSQENKLLDKLNQWKDENRTDN